MSNFKRALPVILSILSGAGVVGTSILVAKKTPDYHKMLDDLKKEKPDATKMDKIKVLCKAYWPALATGGATIASIAAGTIISKKVEASLSAAVILAQQGWAKYENKVKEVIGKAKNDKIIESIAKDDSEKYEEEIKKLPEDDGKKLYWEQRIGFFRTTPEKIAWAINYMNTYELNGDMHNDNHEPYQTTLADFLNYCDAEPLDPTISSYDLLWGWTRTQLDDMYDWPYITIEEKEIKTKSGSKAIVISFQQQKINVDQFNANDKWSSEEYVDEKDYIDNENLPLSPADEVKDDELPKCCNI